MSEIWVRERVLQRQIADWIKKFSGFLLLKIILIMSFIILMQRGFLYRGHWVGMGPGTYILIMRLFL